MRGYLLWDGWNQIRSRLLLFLIELTSDIDIFMLEQKTHSCSSSRPHIYIHGEWMEHMGLVESQL
jgi:hypothetical protein